MLSQRRIRLYAATALVVFIIYLYYSGESQSVRNQKFYRTTVAAIEAEKNANANAADHPSYAQKDQTGRPVAEYIIGDKQEPAIPRATQTVAPHHPDTAAAEEEVIPIAGRTVMTVSKERGDTLQVKEGQETIQEEKEEEKQEVKAELNGILKRSPIIIFSKSYCPYSKKAKSILLGEYSITPAPFVVELDHHPLGPQLQAVLAENTGRRTVPNILVNGKSIGGGDDIAAMDAQDVLASKLKSLGGGWLQEVKRKELEHDD